MWKHANIPVGWAPPFVLAFAAGSWMCSWMGTTLCALMFPAGHQQSVLRVLRRVVPRPGDGSVVNRMAIFLLSRLPLIHKKIAVRVHNEDDALDVDGARLLRAERDAVLHEVAQLAGGRRVLVADGALDAEHFPLVDEEGVEDREAATLGPDPASLPEVVPDELL